ncbi:hypothetical protein LZ31DRAFT_600038 [Colletotrichum somersetense]|nr:hypothetical protein LZ31DRAFT_600038 [Colletotrichum somersetense]
MVMSSLNGSHVNLQPRYSPTKINKSKAKISRQSRNDEFNNLAAALERRKLNPNVPDSVNSLERTAEWRAVPLRPMPGDAGRILIDQNPIGMTSIIADRNKNIHKSLSPLAGSLPATAPTSRNNDNIGKSPLLRRSMRSAAALANASIMTRAPDDVIDNQDCNILPSIEDIPRRKRIAVVPDSEGSDDTESNASDESLIILPPTETDRVTMRTNPFVTTANAPASAQAEEQHGANTSGEEFTKRALAYKESKARASHALNAAKNDVELGKLMVQDLENTVGAKVGYSERLRIWNNTAIEACETREFRRNLKNFLAKNANFLEKYDRHNLLRDKEHMIWDQEMKQRMVPAKALGSLSITFHNMKLALDQNIALLDEVLLEYQAPGPETLAEIPVRQTMAKVKLAEAEDRLVSAQEWLDSMQWRVDEFYPKWFRK